MIARLLLVALLSSTALAQGLGTQERTERARAHFERGKAHFNLGEYEDAVREFEAGYREKPQPLFLYDIAESARKAGQRDKALRMYQQYLREKPDAAERAQVERHIAELEQAPPTEPEPPPLAPRPSEPPVAAPPVVAPPPPPLAIAPTPPPAVERPWQRDPLAIALAAVGAAALVVGAIDLGVEAPRWQDRNASYAAHQLAVGAAPHLTADVVLLPAGAVLLAAGVLRWGLVRRARVRLAAGSLAVAF